MRKPPTRRRALLTSLFLSIVALCGIAGEPIAAQSEGTTSAQTLLVGSQISPMSSYEHNSLSSESSVSDAGTHAKHAFFDRANAWLTGIEVTALLADGITTQHLQGLDPLHVCSREADPIARPFVERGWPGQILGGVLVMAADAGLRYLYHKRDHHRLERWWPSIVIAYGATGAIHNARFWNRRPCE